ncbi:helix-turn-helix transcriptional regulator [Dongshaea marina]|uniref:helix-turn-helix transcriptional regulator n=1 Tax=Dongshaea marina TaxID=2047966 RepID=UPI000D3E3B8E|nr:AraC family transcriptional regulator [Dongshaea marina]
MSSLFYDIVENVISELECIRELKFATDGHMPPPFSYQVNFPRLELVLQGRYRNELDDPVHGVQSIVLEAGDALYVPPNCWNKPDWEHECSVLSLLFGKRQLGFSLVSKKQGSEGFFDVQKHSVQAKTGYAIDSILTALNTLARESVRQPMDRHLLLALLGYCRLFLEDPASSANKRSEDLYQGICIYIQENFHRAITRDSIARRFNISPNHLSRLFRHQGHMRLVDYIGWVRLERAKFMLKRYNIRLHEIASRCGYRDVNYFCRVFKDKTGRTPTEYRSLGKLAGETSVEGEAGVLSL